MMTSIILLFVISLLIILSQIIEVYSYVLKGSASQKHGRQIIGLANWVQYFSRILYVIVLMMMSFMFEVLQQGLLSIQVVTIVFLISGLISVLIVSSEKVLRLLQFLMKPLALFSYKGLEALNFILDIKKARFGEVFLYTMVSSLCVLMAFVSPFLIAEKFPEYRMMATYSGQALNFFATAIIFSITEPRMFRELDTVPLNENEVSETACSIITAKIISQFFMFLVLLFYVLMM